MAKGDQTIILDSNLGQRLAKIKKSLGYKLFWEGESLPIVSEITVGRSPDNNIVIDDSMASRKHAVFQKIRQDYYIKDLGSSNGTYVNGQKVPKDKYVRITIGDEILVGRTKLNVA
jgi:pSer/pThr/pTyr-binding forkhead associated (FHA) protein